MDQQLSMQCAQTYQSPELKGIHLSAAYRDVNYTFEGTKFSGLAGDIFRRSLGATTSDAPPLTKLGKHRWGQYYRSYNVIQLKRGQSPMKGRMRSIVIHEGVHAIQNKDGLASTFLFSEAIAYIVEFVARLLLEEPHKRADKAIDEYVNLKKKASGDPTSRLSSEVYGVIAMRGLYSGRGVITPADFQRLRNPLRPYYNVDVPIEPVAHDSVTPRAPGHSHGAR